MRAIWYHVSPPVGISKIIAKYRPRRNRKKLVRNTAYDKISFSNNFALNSLSSSSTKGIIGIFSFIPQMRAPKTPPRPPKTNAFIKRVNINSCEENMKNEEKKKTKDVDEPDIKPIKAIDLWKFFSKFLNKRVDEIKPDTINSDIISKK